MEYDKTLNVCRPRLLPRYVRAANHDFFRPADHNHPENGFRLARIYPLSPDSSVPTVVEPVKLEPASPESSPTKPELATPILDHMTTKQKELGGPIINSVDMVLVPIPAGEFMMGSPESESGRRGNETQHEVKITQPFYLSAHEVTQQQYLEVMGNNPEQYARVDDKPVTNVNWHEAVAFYDKLSEQEGKDYRLPTEAEWEYACRAGTTTAYSFGNDASGLGEHAWHRGNSGQTTHPVGEKLPNAWGLYDMHGNVWEWCQDWYGDYGKEKVVTDPTGAASGVNRVLRGGAFFNRPEFVRAADRTSSQPDNRNRNFGFRLARTYDLSP